MRYVASISYGKDSLAQLEVIHQNNLPLTDIITADIMATPHIPAYLPELVEFCARLDREIEERYGIPVTHVRAEKSFMELFYKERTERSKYTGIVLSGADKAAAREQIKRMAQDELESIRCQVSDQISEYSIVAVAVAAYDVCGLTGWELGNFCNKFLLQFECLAAGTVQLDDLRAMLALEAQAELHGSESLRDDDKPLLIGAGNCRVICWQGERGSIRYWAEKVGIRPQTVRSRLARGWELERALTVPVKGAEK